MASKLRCTPQQCLRGITCGENILRPSLGRVLRKRKARTRHASVEGSTPAVHEGKHDCSDDHAVS
eukprot:14538015-Alexandrium_andersonii.AAC.1